MPVKQVISTGFKGGFFGVCKTVVYALKRGVNRLKIRFNVLYT